MNGTIRGAMGMAVLGLALAWTGGVRADDRSDALDRAREAFERGLRGSKEASESAAEQFRRLAEADPRDPLVLVYHGSSFTLRARDAFWPWRKLKLGEEGLDRIDRALRLLEADKAGAVAGAARAETTLVAISTFLQMPDRFFHRFESGKRLLGETLSSPAFAHYPPYVQARFHEQSAVVARIEERKGDEAAHLRAMLALYGSGPRADDARKRLSELGE